MSGKNYKAAKVSEVKPQWLNLIQSVAIAFAITCIVFIAYAIILTYTDITDKYIGLVSAVSTAISAMVSCYDCAKGAENKGLFWGIGSGLIYALLLFLVCSAAGNSFEPARFITFLIAGAAGGIGGILGINSK